MIFTLHVRTDNPSSAVPGNDCATCFSALRTGLGCVQLKVPVLDVEVGYHVQQSKGVDWVFVDHPSYLRPGGIYGDQDGVYGDNQVNTRQQSAYSWLVVEVCLHLAEAIYMHPEGLACHSYPAAT